MAMIAQDPMTIALCPSTNCTTVSHLSCLCSDFLEHERSTNAKPGRLAMIPRGGECRSCRTYILWGDVIRGCYRRRGDDAPQLEEDDMEDEEEQSLEDAENGPPPTRRPSKKARGKTASRRRGGAAPRKRPAALPEEGSSEGEFFDLNNVSGSSEEDSAGGQPLMVVSVQRTTMASRTAVGRGDTPENNRQQEAAAVPSSSTRLDPTRAHPQRSSKVSRVARRDVQVPRTARTAEPRSTTTNVIAEIPSVQVDAPTARPRVSLGSQHRQNPRTKALPAYVEISDSPGSDLPDLNVGEEPAPTGAPRHAFGAQLDDDPDAIMMGGSDSPVRPGSPHQRLSRALSTLSISSESELPDTAHILRDLKRNKKQDGDEDVVVVSD